MEVDSAIETKMLAAAKEYVQGAVDIAIQGIGLRFYPDGRKFQGSFANNKRDGYGVLYYPDGQLEYEGYWKTDKREGRGAAIGVDGNTYKGEWRNDE